MVDDTPTGRVPAPRREWLPPDLLEHIVGPADTDTPAPRRRGWRVSAAVVAVLVVAGGLLLLVWWR